MGCDGGTIPRRDELVRTKKKPEQKDKNAETVAKWKHCALSQDPLHKPIVACELGKLYNKEAILKYLLNKVPTEIASHINKLSDVKELNLTEKNGFEAKSNQKGDEYVDFHDSQYICPVTGLEMNGKQRFYMIWKCGCVLSERAIKEVKSDICHKCGKPYVDNDIIILNGSNEEIETLREKMVERHRLAKLEKKKKKCALSCGHVEKKIKLESEEVRNNSSKIKIESTEHNKIKIEHNKPNTSGSNKHINGKMVDKLPNGKVSTQSIVLPEKAKTTYSIAKDPSASAAYKSLFTSHTSAKKQEKAHWITHNPLYY